MRRQHGSGGSSSTGTGRVRQRLSKRLASLGWEVLDNSPEGYGITGAVGGNRTSRYDDTTVCWEAQARHPELAPSPSGLHLVSYDTMSDCSRGCAVSVDDQFLAWCHADERTNKGKQA